MREFDSLPDNTTVYRVLLRRQWIDEDTGRVKADAYFLRVNEYRQCYQLEFALDDVRL